MTIRVVLEDTRRAFVHSVNNAHQRWSERAGCLLRLETDSGLVGRGEASPLPGFSLDRLDVCKRALAGLDLGRVPSRLEPGQSVWAELAQASSALPSTLPAARAALEAALLELWALGSGRPAWALLLEAGAPAPTTRRVAALLMGEPEQAVQEARRARERQIQAFKFKVGRLGALERELAAVRQLRHELGREAVLRLDANRGFSAAQASDLRAFASEELALEFIEEPYSSRERSSLAGLPLPLALDESLAEIDPDAALLQAWGVRAVVLKPTLLGGITACARWAKVAAEAGAAVILSHAFEGPSGLALSATLALTLGSADRAHGLDLDSARVAGRTLPFFSGSAIHPWLEPGFGLREAPH